MNTQVLFLLVSFSLLISHAAALSSVFTSVPYNRQVHKVLEGENVLMVWEYDEASGETVRKISWVIVNPTDNTRADKTIAAVTPPSTVSFQDDLNGRAKFLGNSSFELLNVTYTDSLLYGCFLYFGLGQGHLRSHFTLEVQVGPNADNPGAVSQKSSLVGEASIVNCTATGTPTPTVIWSYSGTEITRGTGFAVLNQTLKSGDPNKTFECYAENDVNKIHVKNVTLYPVYIGPNADNPGAVSQKSSLVGEASIVNCTATGTPTPTVIWSYSGTEITRATGLAVLNQTLKSGDPNKTYECHAENYVKKIHVKSVTLYLIYIGPYAVAEEHKWIPCLERQACKVNCSATGIPTPTVSWYHQGAEITKANRLATLSLTVKRGDPNKTYECYAENYVKRIFVRNATVYFDGIMDPPKVILKPGNWSGKEGSTLNIDCTATGFPPLTITLTGPLGPLTNPYSFDVQKSHHGAIFYCTANNSAGEDSSWMKLDVHHKPNSTKLVSSSVGDKVLLTCTSDANPPVTNYTLYYQETCRSDKRINLPTKDQCSWETDKHGFFHVIAENPSGKDISNVICVKCCPEEKETLTEEPSPFGPHWKELFIMLLALCAIFLLLAVILLVILCKWRRKFESGGETSFNLEKYENEAILNGGAPKNNQAKPESKEMGEINHTLEKETTQTTIVPEEMTPAKNNKTKPAENNEKKPMLVGSGDTKAPVNQLGPPVHFPEGRHRMPSIETTTRGKRQEKA